MGRISRRACHLKKAREVKAQKLEAKKKRCKIAIFKILGKNFQSIH